MGKIVIDYKGCVNTLANLGDYYTVKDTGYQYYWSSVAPVGPITDWKVINAPEAGTPVSPWTENTIATVDGTPTTIATVSVPDDTVYLIMIDVVARRTNGSDRGGFARRAVCSISAIRWTSSVNELYRY